MAAYSKRHYGDHTSRLRNPHVIVEHISVASSAAAVYNTFAPDHPDPELHELPNVGLNWTAIGIEHAGHSDA